ncbi:MAG: hypothetical protein PHX01_04565 [Clostridia bacterium]|nr:hypothetical protein [Clostridia bacterium]
MDSLKKRVGYLKGLAEGFALDKDSKEGKLFEVIIDSLDKMVEVIEEVVLNQLEIAEYLEMMDEYLADLEDVIFGEEGEFVFDEEEDDEEEDEGEKEEIELACPHCLEVLDLEPSILEDEDVLEIICPNCDKAIHVNDEQVEKKEKEKTEEDEAVRELSH